MIAIAFALVPLTAFGIIYCAPEVDDANRSTTVPYVAASFGQRDWSRQNPDRVRLPLPSRDRKMAFHFPENLDPDREDFVLLFYSGSPVTPETVRESRLSGFAPMMQFQFDPDTEVGGVALVGKLGHDQLASVIPSDRKILGGVRYNKGEKKNSIVFKDLSGELVESLFFEVDLQRSDKDSQ